MAATKRSKTQRRADMILIETLYIQGMSQQRIAERLSGVRGYSLSRAQVRYDLEDILIEWADVMKVKRHHHIVAQLKKLDRLENEAWEAWERSKENRERLRARQSQVAGAKDAEGNATATVTHSETTKETEGRDGNPKFMEIIIQTIDRRARLLALYQDSEPFPFRDEAPGVRSFEDLVASSVQYARRDGPREIEVLPPLPRKDDNGKNGSGMANSE